jgi:acyl-coenzyme A synthetase/AMP-(fatty) acid ligase
MNNPRSLVEWIDEHRIEIWYSVPSVWISIINFADIASRTFRHLRVVLFAGEVFPPKFLRELMRLLPGRLYYNLYGPTETNVCTYHRVHTAGEIGDAPVPIGKACANTGVMALDATLREVAVGQTGELHVFGPGVAKGYYRNAEKTAESFRRVTVAPYGERVIYSTGDVVVRIDADTYRYVGRKDFMVKCAGYRVELQEIERALDNHPLVRESAVVPRYREQRGSVALEAFVSLKPGAVLSIVDAKKFCGEKLPRYMIPETFRIIDEFPRNANGKIDRQLLQSGDAGQLARQGGA